MYITYLLLAVTILVSVKAFSDQVFRDRLMLNPYSVIHGRQSYRVFTHAFIHGDVMHLMFNMFALYLFAVQLTPETPGNHPHYSLEPELIARYGPKGYLYFGALYLGGILFSTMWSLFRHRNNPYYNSLGASGAISSVIFAYILLNPMDKMGVFPFPAIIPAFIFGPLLLLFEYWMAKRGGTGIAHDAHLSGAVFGIIFMTILDYRILLDFLRNFTG
jgi:membrane associated rhomboid family serine protease